MSKISVLRAADSVKRVLAKQGIIKHCKCTFVIR